MARETTTASISRRVRDSGDALLTIINDILDFSKIESGKLELEEQPFDVGQCVEGALDLVAHEATRKGLELAYLVEESLQGRPTCLAGQKPAWTRHPSW